MFLDFNSASPGTKQQWVADQARTGVFAGVGKEALWQDFADWLIADSLSKE